jgi:hypothetical protein
MGTPNKQFHASEFHKVWYDDQPRALEYLENDVRSVFQWAGRWGLAPSDKDHLGAMSSAF